MGLFGDGRPNPTFPLKDFRVAKHADRGYDLPGVTGILTQYVRRPQDVPNNYAATVAAISQIAAKSIMSAFRAVSLLTLNLQMQEAIRLEHPLFLRGTSLPPTPAIRTS